MNMVNRILGKMQRLTLNNPLNMYLGQAHYGNAAGFWQNYIGQQSWKSARKSAAGQTIRQDDATPKLREAASKIENDGYLLFNDQSIDPVIKTLGNKFSDWCANSSSASVSQFRQQASSVELGPDFFELFPECAQLLTDSTKATLREYYGANFQVFNIHIYRTYRPSDDSGLGEGGAYGSTLCWHQDASPSDTLKLFFLLGDVSADDGPMLMLNRKKSQDIVSSFKVFNHQKHGRPQQFESIPHDMAYCGQKGTGLIVNTNTCLHRASIPSAKPRDMITFYLGVNRSTAEDPMSHPHREPSIGIGRLLQ